MPPPNTSSPQPQRYAARDIPASAVAHVGAGRGGARGRGSGRAPLPSAAAAAAAPLVGGGDLKRKKKVTSSQEASSTLLMGMSAASTHSLSSTDIKNAIEHGDTAARVKALESLVRQHVNGESQNHMIMSVIKYLTPLSDHYLKKLVLYFWEVIDKTDEDGHLLPEIILICSFLRGDLLHHNEYVRGLTLRFLCKIQEKELVEPLVSAVVQNLTYHIPYVRRHALRAVARLHRKFPDLLPDAVDLVDSALRSESDVSALRGGFDMLAEVDPERAALFLAEYCDTHVLAESGSAFLMSVVDFCRQRIQASAMEKARYVPVLFAVLQNKDPAVRYQCASTLLSLSSSPTAITQAALTYIDLLRTHTDNTVRLIVLEQLERMKAQHAEVLQESLPDVLSVLHQRGAAPEMRQCVWKLATDLITRKTAESFVSLVRKELLHLQQELAAAAAAATAAAATTTSSSSISPTTAGRTGPASALATLEGYRLDLLHALRVAVERFPDVVADSIAVSLPDYYFDNPVVRHALQQASTGAQPLRLPGLLQTNAATTSAMGFSESSNLEVLVLLKRTLHSRPSVRRAALQRLRLAFGQLAQSDLLRAALWIFGAFAEAGATNGGAADLLAMLQEALQPLPLTPPCDASGGNGNNGGSGGNGNGGAVDDGGAENVGLRAVTTVREDGSYVTTYVSAAGPAEPTTTDSSSSSTSSFSTLRLLVTHGDGFLVCAIASAVVRLVHLETDAAASGGEESGQQAAVQMGVDLLAELLRYAGVVEGTRYALDDDAQEQLRLALSMLLSSRGAPSGGPNEVWKAALETSVALLDVVAGGGRGRHGPVVGRSSDADEQQQQQRAKKSFLEGGGGTAAALALSLDAPLLFTQLTSATTTGAVAYEMEAGMDAAAVERSDVLLAGGTSSQDPMLLSPRKFLERLEKVVPLSGSSDSIYCEACVTVNEFDVAVDWRLINCTPHLLQNVMVDLASLGGMKLCERPQVYSLAPNATLTMRTSLKVASTESGVIFGSLLFDYPDGSHACLVLNHMDVDIMNYISPVKGMQESEFRRKWRALDWENRIVVSTPLTDLRRYVDLVERELNMSRVSTASPHSDDDVLAEEGRLSALLGEVEERPRIRDNNDNDNDDNDIDNDEDRSGCVSCNFAARTSFGEDVLANVSVESDEKGSIRGIIRIRSGTHTLAYGVGKKLNVVNGEHVTTAVRSGATG